MRRLLPIFVLLFAVTLPGGILCWITLSLIRMERAHLAERMRRSYASVFEKELESIRRWYETFVRRFDDDELNNYLLLKKEKDFITAFVVVDNGEIVFPTAGLPYAEYPSIPQRLDYEALYPLYEAEQNGDVPSIRRLEGVIGGDERTTVSFAYARMDAGYRSSFHIAEGRLEGVVDAPSAACYLKTYLLYKEGDVEAAAVPLLQLAKRMVSKTANLTASEIRFYSSFITDFVKKNRKLLSKLFISEIEKLIMRIRYMQKWRRDIETVIKGAEVTDEYLVVFGRGRKQYYVFCQKDGYLKECVWERLSRSFSGPVSVAVIDSDGDTIYGKEDGVRVVSKNLPFDDMKVALYYRGAEMISNEAVSRTGLLLVISVLGVVALVCGATILYTALLRRMRESARKSDFLSNISHELKTPLTVIRMNSETLATGRYKDERERRRLLDVITHQTERLGNMIDRLLRFSRMERGVVKYNISRVRLNDFIDSVVYEFKLRHRNENVRLYLNVPEPAVDVEVDADAMKEALLNILDNSVKYTTSEPKKVYFRVSIRGDSVLFEIEDKGVGIPKWAQKRVFEQFFRIAKKEMRTEGTGIGLSIAACVVKAHRGKITLQSEEGVGSLFSIVLPLRQ